MPPEQEAGCSNHPGRTTLFNNLHETILITGVQMESKVPSCPILLSRMVGSFAARITPVFSYTWGVGRMAISGRATNPPCGGEDGSRTKDATRGSGGWRFGLCWMGPGSAKREVRIDRMLRELTIAALAAVLWAAPAAADCRLLLADQSNYSANLGFYVDLE